MPCNLGLHAYNIFSHEQPSYMQTIKSGISKMTQTMCTILSLFLCILGNFVLGHMVKENDNKQVDQESNYDGTICTKESGWIRSIQSFFVCKYVLMDSIQLCEGGHHDAHMKDLVTVTYKVKAAWEKTLGDVRAKEEATAEEPDHLLKVVCQAGLPVGVKQVKVQLVPAKHKST